MDIALNAGNSFKTSQHLSHSSGFESKQSVGGPMLIEVVQEAVDKTGMTEVPVAGRNRLLSDNGSGYVSRGFRDYLSLVGIKHILAAPFHPQTNGKLECYHQTIKQDVKQVLYEKPSNLGRRLSRPSSPTTTTAAITRCWAT